MSQSQQVPGVGPASLSYTDALPTEILEKALEAARVRLVAMKGQISELQRQVAETEAEHRLLGQLLAVRQGETSDRSSGVQARAVASESSAARTMSHPTMDAVVDVLEESEHPIHVSELMRLLAERNVVIPGAGTQANLISHMSRDPRIVRPSRGMYALAAWGLQDMPKSTRKRTRVRRGRANAAR